jgi:hypothetical protein
VPEGMSAEEVGKEIAHHAEHGGGHEARDRHDRILSIAEAVLLSIVAVMAAWSGYAAAKWSTDSRVKLADASTLRSEANLADIDAIDRRNFDSSTFEAWFSAFTARNKEAMRIAERRFRPQFKIAFDAWRRTHPETNPHAPKGPTYMPSYKEPGVAKARKLDAQATTAFADGSTAGTRSDDYVRTTVFLASVLFLVGISTQFRIRGVRYALVGLGAVLLIVSLVQLTQLPAPPS